MAESWPLGLFLGTMAPGCMAQPGWFSAIRESLPEHELDSPAASRGALFFALALFGVSLSWLAIVREVNVSFGGITSYVLQQALFWGAFFLIDRRLAHAGATFAWAAWGTLYATCIVIDAFLMRMTSLPLREILPMLLASHHVVEGLREIGLTPWRLLVLFGGLVGAIVAGGWVRWLLSAHCARVRTRVRVRWGVALLVVLAVAFVAEQSAARDDSDYLHRATRMPAYAQLFSTSSRSLVIELAEPVEHSTRATWLSAVGPARNPRHVLYVLLESFRSDVIAPAVTPVMWQLAQQGERFDNAMAEATYTPLSWSVLLFDENAHDNLFGRHSGRPEPLGSWLLAVMRKAGYQPHVYVSTNLTYARTRERLLGSDSSHLDFFQAAADIGDDPSDKNENDRAATEHMVRFIEGHAWDERPQFLLLQLDSTHYTYPFPESEAIFEPYSENLALPRAIETRQEAALLRNRYLNAAHFVDRQLGRVIEALRRKGVYDEMAVVLTADHGEGLSPGLQGHAAVYDATKRVPLVLRFPGKPAGRSQQLISHRDILPSLTAYLGVAVPEGKLRGRDAARAASPGVFTLAPSGRYGQLTTSAYVVDFSLVFRGLSLTATPMEDDAGHTVAASEWLPLLTSFVRNEPLPSPPAAAR
jgi:glucan phosphoethanolaminetransferase (alkaline phosphatase superfamily)